MQKRLVKTRLIFFRNDQDISLFMENILCLTFSYSVSICILIHHTFRVFGVRNIRVCNTTRERNHHLKAIIALLANVSLNLIEITDSSKPRGCHNHHFPLTANCLAGHFAEGLYDNGCFLRNIIWVQFCIPANQFHCLGCRYLRVIRYVFCHFIAGLIGSVICKHIHNEAFFNGLPHAVHMERMECTVYPFLTENL